MKIVKNNVTITIKKLIAFYEIDFCSYYFSQLEDSNFSKIKSRKHSYLLNIIKMTLMT